MILDDLKTWFPNLGADHLNALNAYAGELLRFNKAINLISSSTVDRLSRVHFADCLLAVEIISPHVPDDATLYDLGSGNGFPGLVFSILRPELEIVLVEKDARKSEFLAHVKELLGLKKASVHNGLVEDLPPSSIKWAVSRAFAPLDRALLLMRHQFQAGGRYFHLKSDTWSVELAHVPSQLFSAWKADHLGDYKIPGTETVNAVFSTTRL